MNKIAVAAIIAGIALGGYLMFRPAGASSDAIYKDPSGFSFAIPGGYEATAAHESGAETITLVKGNDRIQLYVTPYDEPAVSFGIARIQKDLPSLDLARARELAVADGKGVEFDDDAGHEVWFAAAGQLYQITAPAVQADAARQIVSTFKLP